MGPEHHDGQDARPDNLKAVVKNFPPKAYEERGRCRDWLLQFMREQPAEVLDEGGATSRRNARTQGLQELF